MNIELPNDMVKLAESTLPEGVDLDLWIIEWARFGLEVSQKASSRREALEMGVNISDAAKEKFDEIVKNIGTGKGQLLEAVGTQIIDFQTRIKELEGLTDLNDKKTGFGKVIKDILAYIDPNNVESVIYKYNQLLISVDDEDGLFRKALRAEIAKDGGLNEKVEKILKGMDVEEGRTQIRRKSAIKGDFFENMLVSVLTDLVGSNEITFRKLGNTNGASPPRSGNSKKGDIQVDFGRSHVLYGHGIIIEAKDDESYHPNSKNPNKCAEHYLEKAMENRECSVGIWIHNKKSAKHFVRDFSVQGNMIFIVWDEDDPSTDWLLLAAIYIAIGRVRISDNNIDAKEKIAISKLVNNLKNEVLRYGRMRKFIDTVKTNASHLDDEITLGAKSVSECLREAGDIMKNLENHLDETDIEFENSDSNDAREEE